MNWSSNKIISRLLTRAKLFLIRRIAVVTQLGHFSLEEESKSPSNSWLTLLGRDVLFETTREFPVRTLSDLNKAIALLDSLAPQNYGQFYFAAPTDKGYRVTFWVLQEPLEKLNVNSRFWLPLPLLLAAEQRQGMFYADVADGKRLNWLFSNERFASTYAAVSPEQFAHRVGVSVPEQVVEIPKQQLNDCLFANLAKLPLHAVPQLRGQLKLPTNQLNWKFLGGALALCAVAYFSVVSAFLSWRLDALNSELTHQGDSIEKSLQDNKTLNQLRQTHTDIVAPLADQKLSAIAFYAIAHAVSNGARIQSVEYNSGKVLLRGEATKALDILSELSKRPRVKNAIFSSPVNKGGKGERFVIEFELQEIAP